MASVNKVILIGNLTRDPELKHTPSGKPVAEISIACNRIRRMDDGSTASDVTYVDITLWGRVAETTSQYMKKGNPIYVEGRLQLDTWTDKATNQQRSRLRVVGENVQFLTSGNNAGNANTYQSQPATTPPPVNTNSNNSTNQVDFEEEDDIPF